MIRVHGGVDAYALMVVVVRRRPWLLACLACAVCSCVLCVSVDGGERGYAGVESS